jgi:hypothetical protein
VKQEKATFPGWMRGRQSRAERWGFTKIGSFFKKSCRLSGLISDRLKAQQDQNRGSLEKSNYPRCYIVCHLHPIARVHDPHWTKIKYTRYQEWNERQ